MKDKEKQIEEKQIEEKQIEEMVNISTKDEQIARVKRANEKDNLIKALLHYANNELTHGIENLIDCEGCANYLMDNLGYRKINENEIIISKEEYEKLKHFEEIVRSGCCFTQKEWLDFCNEDSNRRTCLRIEEREKERKETAEKIFKALYSMRDVYAEHYEYEIRLNEYNLQELAKQYGVEIKE